MDPKNGRIEQPQYYPTRERAVRLKALLPAMERLVKAVPTFPVDDQMQTAEDYGNRDNLLKPIELFKECCQLAINHRYFKLKDLFSSTEIGQITEASHDLSSAQFNYWRLKNRLEKEDVKQEDASRVLYIFHKLLKETLLYSDYEIAQITEPY